MSSSVCRGSSGSSTRAEPPPDNRKNTSVFSSHLFSSARMASAAFQLSSFGTGCPAAKYLRPGMALRGRAGAATTPSKRTKGARTWASPSTMACEALPIATKRSFSNSARLYDFPSHQSRVPSRRSFCCIVAGISIAARVSWKIWRASCFKSAIRARPGFFSLSELPGSAHSSAAALRKAQSRFPRPCRPFSSAFPAKPTRCAAPAPRSDV